MPVAEVERVGVAAYVSVGATEDDARFLLATNLDKALQGDHARGLGKLPGLIAAARAGTLDVHPRIEVVRERGATALVDGGRAASGRLVCRRAMELAIDKAATLGVGFVGARSSGELLTPYVLQAAEAGMVGMAMVQSVPTVAPFGGHTPLIGNGPFAVAVPGGEHDPVVVDMSFTQSSASGVLLAAEQGQQVPPGVLLDEHGDPTTDATEFPDPIKTAATGGGICVRGTLTPLGNSHKGYAMLFTIGLLSHLLTDTDPPWELFYDLPERGRYGTLLIAIDPGAFAPADTVGDRVDHYIDTLAGAPRRDGSAEILYPGQRSQQLRRERRESGTMAIPVTHFDALCALAADVGIDPPERTSP